VDEAGGDGRGWVSSAGPGRAEAEKWGVAGTYSGPNLRRQSIQSRIWGKFSTYYLQAGKINI
jgi:hypothetical protein